MYLAYDIMYIVYNHTFFVGTNTYFCGPAAHHQFSHNVRQFGGVVIVEIKYTNLQ